MAGSRTNRPGRPDERGFVLITALWLLILIGAIAALLLARGLAAARAASGEAEALRDALALDGAIETVAADLVINGERSLFAATPAARSVTVGGREVRVEIVAESGKIDLNEARPELIARVLAALGWDGASREAFLAALVVRRAERRPLTTMAQVEALAAHSGGGEACLGDYLTVFSGRSEPDPAQASAQLARLLGAAAAAGSRPPGPGAAIRIEVSMAGGSSAGAVLRTGGLLDQPVTVSSWDEGGYYSRSVEGG